MNKILGTLFGLIFASTAFGGTFEVQESSANLIWVEYTGMVDYSDVDKWEKIVEYADYRTIVLVINSGGGYAHAGVELYWALEAYPLLITVGGSDFGAWSAAAVMWLAGDIRDIEKGGAVWFHAAYCTWDPYAGPDIGCDTSAFQVELIYIFEDAEFNGQKFNEWLNVIQYSLGTDGWIGVTNEGADWWIYDSTIGWRSPFDVTKVLPIGVTI